MNKLFAAMTSVALAGVCSWSSAGIIPTVTTVTTNVPAGFTGYKITMTSETGLISGLDFDTAGVAGKAFSNLTLHQRWQITVIDPEIPLTATVPTPVGTLVTGSDSHLIYDPNNVALVASPQENNSGTGSPLSAVGFVYGLGTTLSGKWSYLFDKDTGDLLSGPSMDVAYLVIKNGTLPANGILATPYVTETVGGTVITAVPVAIAVPEPTSLSLIGLGAMAILGRRRKA